MLLVLSENSENSKKSPQQIFYELCKHEFFFKSFNSLKEIKMF